MSGSVSFDRAADYYDRTRAIPDGVLAHLVPALLAELPSDEMCLEIGIGTGRIAMPLVAAGVRIVGVDISNEMLRRLAQKREARWPQVAIADATRLPFGDHTFGSAIASHVLHLIAGWRAALAEIIRVVRPGGVLVASRGGRDRPDWLLAVNAHFYTQADDPAWPPGAGSIDDVDAHMREFGVEPRPLPESGVEVETSIEQVLRNLEAGYWSACWNIEPAVRRAAAAATREWAQRELGDLEVKRASRESSVWHAYVLPK